jgi:hypothetical protein
MHPSFLSYPWSIAGHFSLSISLLVSPHARLRFRFGFRLVTSLRYGKSECEHYAAYGIVRALRFAVVGQTGNKSTLAWGASILSTVNLTGMLAPQTQGAKEWALVIMASDRHLLRHLIGICLALAACYVRINCGPAISVKW